MLFLNCNCGTSSTPLKVTSQSNLTMKGKFPLTEKNNVPNINVLPFGNCKNFPFNLPCLLSITGKWENKSKTFTVNYHRPNRGWGFVGSI
ncbi:PAAR-like protein [Cetobacterium sp.]|uniref:PAAR-like protein n=1 Tax=Cetobacterium sp. TaxID=2071632 RepID=UPI003AF18617